MPLKSQIQLLYSILCLEDKPEPTAILERLKKYGATNVLEKAYLWTYEDILSGNKKSHIYFDSTSYGGAVVNELPKTFAELEVAMEERLKILQKDKPDFVASLIKESPMYDV